MWSCRDADLKWGEPPPAFRTRRAIRRPVGRPGKAGPVRHPDQDAVGFQGRHHWHPGDEHVTLLEGDATLQMDDGAQSQDVSRGAYVLYAPARMHHAVSTRNGATVQVMAMGPFELTYVVPKEHPRKRKP
jgi:mannose-6-phosphate isomerase-like protein (cupin superfamily)